MIIARIIGGLGNQMFQYAAGRALSLANDCPLKLDISGFESYALHNGYELDIFNIEAEIAGRKDISSLTGSISTTTFVKVGIALMQSAIAHIKTGPWPPETARYTLNIPGRT